MRQLIGKKNKIIIYLLFLFILSTTSAKFINDQNTLSSSVSKINTTGLSERKNLEISNNLNNFLYKSIFLISKDEIRKILQKHNIIQEFNIMKIYPSTLNIKIKPTKFIARVSNNSQYLVGANGKLIEDKSNNEILIVHQTCFPKNNRIKVFSPWNSKAWNVLCKFINRVINWNNEFLNHLL